VLDHCKYSFYHSYHEDYTWQDVPKLAKSARDATITWAEMVTQNHERLGCCPSDFFASADVVSNVLCTKVCTKGNRLAVFSSQTVQLGARFVRACTPTD